MKETLLAIWNAVWAGDAPFQTTSTHAFEFPGGASLRFLQGCGFRRSVATALR